MLSRRTLLRTGGATATILMAGSVGAGLYAHGPGMKQARAPWSQAGQSFGDIRLDALAYAILAPNPHNRQPWQFELIGDTELRVFCDLDKRLPYTDPSDRQITIGFGCMLELLRMAAASKGYRVDVEPFPDGQTGSRLGTGAIANVSFEVDAEVQDDALFSEVLTRRSSKDPYDLSQGVTQQTLDELIKRARAAMRIGGTIDKGRVEQLRELCWLGWMIEYETDLTRRESIDLMRIGNRAVVENPDGIDMGGVQMGLLKMTGIVTPEGLDTPDSQAYNAGIEMYRDIINSAMGFCWVSADENTRLTQLDAGRDWVRLNLAAQQLGLCIHPLSQVLQEFPEMAETYTATQQALEVEDGGVIHMLGRLGYSKFPAPSPRWPLQSKLITS